MGVITKNRPKDYMYGTTPKQMFFQAVSNFPYPDMQRTTFTAGSFEPDYEGVVNYCEKHTFYAGKLCHERIEGCGWFLLHVANEVIELTVRAHFARNGDWQNGQILPYDERLQGHYDVDARQWTLKITPY